MKKKSINYHGYLALPRHAKFLIHDLGHSLFGFYLALTMEARWSRANEYFGCVVSTQEELAKVLRTSQSTISRGLKKLQDKHYLILHKEYIRLKYFPLFLVPVADRNHSKDYANLNELYSDVHKINAGLHEQYALWHNNQVQNKSQSLYSSSKVNSSSSNNYLDIDEIDKELRDTDDEEAQGVD